MDTVLRLHSREELGITALQAQHPPGMHGSRDGHTPATSCSARIDAKMNAAVAKDWFMTYTEAGRSEAVLPSVGSAGM